MKKRFLAPGFFNNEDLGGLDPMARILFLGLTLYCDCKGKFEWRPKRIHAVIFPYDTRCDILSLLDSLKGYFLIAQYNVNGNEYGIIPKFLTHQSPHPNEKASIIPDPPTDLTSLQEISSNSSKVQEVPCLNNNNIITNITYNKTTSCPSSTAVEYAQLLRDLLLKEQPKARVPDDKKLVEGKTAWANVIERMIRIDNRDPIQIEKMIRWIFSENVDAEASFVVKSAQSLREKFDRIETQMGRGNGWMKKYLT